MAATFNYSIFSNILKCLIFCKLLVKFYSQLNIDYSCVGRSELSFDMMAISNCLQGFAQGGWSQTPVSSPARDLAVFSNLLKGFYFQWNSNGTFEYSTIFLSSSEKVDMKLLIVTVACFINNVKWPSFLFWTVFTVIMIISMLLSFAILEFSRTERCQLGTGARKKQVGTGWHMVTFLLWLNAQQVKIFLDITGGQRG